MSDNEPKLTAQGPGVVDPKLAGAAIASLGPDSAWLALSIALYGWRTYYDLAVSSVTGHLPKKAETDAFPWPPRTEFQAVRDLHVQSLAYMAAEQFLRLLRACRYHRISLVFRALGVQFDDEPFLTAYMSHAYVGSLLREARNLDRGELADLIRASEVAAIAEQHLAQRRQDQPVERDILAQLLGDTTDLGGLLVPTRAITQDIPANATQQANELIDVFMRNIEQLEVLTATPKDTNLQTSLEPQPMRAVDNAFRHGLRLLFRRAMPERRLFAALDGDPSELSEYAIDVLLPREANKVAYGTVDATPERTLETLESLRQICTRTGQLARSFLGAQVLGNAGLTYAASNLELPAVPEAIAEWNDPSTDSPADGA